MDVGGLRRTCKGTVTAAGEAGFGAALHGDLWNRLVPDRAPAVVVKAADEDDVIAAIGFARANRLKVAVRGGGHNWCQPTLRNGGLLIDIQGFDKVVSLDVAARRAVIQPIVSNRDVQRLLNPLGLAFPTGHCPQVKASGYFLGGGMAWNPTVWGCGAESLEAIELVTPAGTLITASATENPDYFWAARGAGPGFFGVVTRYHLRLHPLPRAIHGAAWYYALADAPAVGDWLGRSAPGIAASVELSQFVVQAPPALRDRAAGDNGWLCMVTGTAFEDTAAAAKAALRPLDDCPVAPLSRAEAAPVDFEALFDASGALWPEGVRARVEAAFSDASPGAMMAAILPLLARAPSPTTVFLFTIFCGPDVPAPQKDMALSMHAKVYGGPWTMWREAADDRANADWHDAVAAALRPFNTGYYLGESNTAARPANVIEAFTPQKWQRLCDLRDRYDPDRLFFDYFEGFGAAG